MCDIYSVNNNFSLAICVLGQIFENSAGYNDSLDLQISSDIILLLF